MIGLALAVALIAGGAAAAFTSNHALKKVAAATVALVGACVALALLGAPTIALLAGVGLALAYCLVGVAVVVRLQEAYGSVEQTHLDSIDDQDEPGEITS
jgi:hypothetical protein